MLKTWPRPIFEKNSVPAGNAGNLPESAVFADFVRTFSLYFVVFSHKSFINNNKKTVGTFRLENGISWISRAALYIFSWNFAHWCKIAMSKMWPIPIFRKIYFSGRKCQKYAGKTGFLAISWDFIISFFWFFAQRCVLIMPKIWLSSIVEKIFFRPKIPEICWK